MHLQSKGVQLNTSKVRRPQKGGTHVAHAIMGGSSVGQWLSWERWAWLDMEEVISESPGELSQTAGSQPWNALCLPSPLPISLSESPAAKSLVMESLTSHPGDSERARTTVKRWDELQFGASPPRQ